MNTNRLWWFLIGIASVVIGVFAMCTETPDANAARGLNMVLPTPVATLPACCAGSGPLACQGICGCPDSGATLLACDDLRVETQAQFQQNWGISDQSMIVNSLGQEGLVYANMGTLTDAGLVTHVIQYDGGTYTLNFDAGPQTPAAVGFEAWSRKKFTPPFTYCESADFDDAGPPSTGAGVCGSGDCWDPGALFALGQECQPNPDGGLPNSIGQANYPPYSPGNGCAESVSNFIPEHDLNEKYGPGSGVGGSGGPGYLNNSNFIGAGHDSIHPIAFTGFGQFHTFAGALNPNVSSSAYWDGILVDTNSSFPMQTDPMFLIIQNRGWSGLKCLNDQCKVTHAWIKVVSGVHPSCD